MSDRKCEVTIEERYVPIKCGSVSLIGIYGKPPFEWGNYFWLVDDQENNTDFRDGIRIYNMWWENLDALTKISLTPPLSDRKVKVRVYTMKEKDGHIHKGGIIVDERVPEEYLYNKLCFTGGAMPPLEVAEDAYDILGDPTNELEQFTNPIDYYGRRGKTYDPKSRMITQWENGHPKIKELKEKYGDKFIE